MEKETPTVHQNIKNIWTVHKQLTQPRIFKKIPGQAETWTPDLSRHAGRVLYQLSYLARRDVFAGIGKSDVIMVIKICTSRLPTMTLEQRHAEFKFVVYVCAVTERLTLCSSY